MYAQFRVEVVWDRALVEALFPLHEVLFLQENVMPKKKASKKKAVKKGAKKAKTKPKKKAVKKTGPAEEV